MRHLTVLVAVLAACSRPAPAPDPLDGVVAAVQMGGEIHVERHSQGRWSTTRVLPAKARALRFSPDARSVAWVEDVRTDGKIETRGWAWPAGAAQARELGPLGLREHEAFGLAIADSGRTVHLALDGTLVDSGDEIERPKGSSPVFVTGDRWAFTDELGCAEGACGAAMRLLAAAPRRVWRTNAQLLLEGDRKIPMTDVLDADVRADGTVIAVRRGSADGHAVDELVVVEALATRVLTRLPLVVAVRWDRLGGLLGVVRTDPQDVYDQLLAHAPEEYEGESQAGDAVRIDLATGALTPIAGLPAGQVRAIVNPR